MTLDRFHGEALERNRMDTYLSVSFRYWVKFFHTVRPVVFFVVLLPFLESGENRWRNARFAWTAPFSLCE